MRPSSFMGRDGPDSRAGTRQDNARVARESCTIGDDASGGSRGQRRFLGPRMDPGPRDGPRTANIHQPTKSSPADANSFLCVTHFHVQNRVPCLLGQHNPVPPPDKGRSCSNRTSRHDGFSFTRAPAPEWGVKSQCQNIQT